MKINLLEETELIVDAREVVYVGLHDGSEECTWEEFKALADTVYSNGYGSAEIRLSLVIVCRDGTVFYREEYDGSEWWNSHKPIPGLFEKPQLCAVQVVRKKLQTIKENY